jgi:hypothetical protein
MFNTLDISSLGSIDGDALAKAFAECLQDASQKQIERSFPGVRASSMSPQALSARLLAGRGSMNFGDYLSLVDQSRTRTALDALLNHAKRSPPKSPETAPNCWDPLCRRINSKFSNPAPSRTSNWMPKVEASVDDDAVQKHYGIKPGLVKRSSIFSDDENSSLIRSTFYGICSQKTSTLSKIELEKALRLANVETVTALHILKGATCVVLPSSQETGEIENVRSRLKTVLTAVKEATNQAINAALESQESSTFT